MNMYVVKKKNNNNNTSGCGFKFQLPKTLIELLCKMWVLAMVYLVAALFTYKNTCPLPLWICTSLFINKVWQGYIKWMQYLIIG